MKHAPFVLGLVALAAIGFAIGRSAGAAVDNAGAGAVVLVFFLFLLLK